MPDRDHPQKSEGDRIVGWGWALGLLLPLVGLMIVAMLISREDPRWKLILGWSLLGIVFYAIFFSSI